MSIDGGTAVGIHLSACLNVHICMNELLVVIMVFA